ncbi:hypothetical protein Leryth_005213 [Lithospermum erythrorhizon]|nr:hypothetical protein Leryth_005213 [Lithospermum erythrorhizon]
MASLSNNFIIFLLLTTCLHSACSCIVENVATRTTKHTQVYWRKLRGVDVMVDYYDGGANPAHDPGKGRHGL